MNDEGAVEFLKELLNIYSPSGKEADLAAYLVKRLKELGFNAFVDHVGNVIASPLSPVPSEPELLFLGHIDTVPGFITVREEGGKIFGRGAVDAKGPLAAFLVALIRVKPKKAVVFVGAVGEETESIGAKHIIPCFNPRYAVVGEPSHWEGITLGYKGRLIIHYTISKPKFHTAAPSINAPEEAIRFWQEFKARAECFNGAINLSLLEICSGEEDFCTFAEMKVGLRLPPGIKPASVANLALSLAGEAKLEFSGEEEAFVAERNTALVKTFLKAIRAEGGKPRFKLKTGTSDMNLAGRSWGCPILAYGPGDSSLDHTPWEHIEIDDYLKAIRVWEKVLEGILGGRKNEAVD